MSAREAILRRIRSATLGPDGRSAGERAGDEQRKAGVRARLETAPRGVIPARGQLPRAERVALFEEMASAASATIARLSSYEEVAAEVSNYLRERNLPAAIRMGEDGRLARVPWAREKTLDVRKGPSEGTDLVGVSHAFAAIAETGSVVLHSGADNPTTLNFLPEHHVVIVDADAIAGDMESVWSALRNETDRENLAGGRSAGGGQDAAKMPRTVNVITGPSRSGDIEQTILLGAHGPRALHLIIVDT
ncbi:LutC/YkgG family protein [Pseudohoeflea coraliihabitans]|uniref:Lactate utilization protein n=1 Tax=Pseudohoeflea coraliihabitans TaxID=2860393 RepID=A0ABS6WMD4_9HYPH|nr:lactate utilization protein [Pseudohoeflea sp. DP4N28-3]MBW3097121.1 lactate utilization protein [Pseudohoeflea sp. DP4N28-3]